jgi:hypothetical protein
MTGPSLTPRSAYDQMSRLHKDLETLVSKDPEQEVLGLAVGVIDVVLAMAAQATGNPSILETVQGVVTPEAIAEGEPLRAADLLVIVGQVLAALPHPLSQTGGRFARRDGLR